MITLEKFTKGFYVLGFYLTPDWAADEELIILSHKGNTRIGTRIKNRSMNL